MKCSRPSETHTAEPARLCNEHGREQANVEVLAPRGPPGVGTGKYAPFRFLCPPEASVINLLPRDV